MTGSPVGVLRRIEVGGHGLYWGMGDISSLVFTVLPLEGHRLARPVERHEQFLAHALRLLNGLDGPFSESVHDYLSMLIWLEESEASVESFTSSSFPALPHCAFMTDKALRDIPPDTILPEDSPWALAENLYHESLHQQLSATILQEDILSDAYDARSAPKISVPWRSTDWEIDRAFHALYVYSRLLPMREQYARSRDLDPLAAFYIAEAIQKGRAALRYLAEALRAFDCCFTDTGKGLVTQIVSEARSVVRAG